MKNSEYYDLLVKEIIADLTANLRIRQFTSNSALIGAFAEESTNELIKKIVFPLRVSTGSVIDKKLLEQNKDLPQLDCIIWNPTPFPALFEKGSFGIIPRTGVCGILEIKSSNYSGVGNAINKVLKMDSELVDEAPPTLYQGKLVSDIYPKSMGVICLFDSSKSDTQLKTLIKENKVCTILEHKGDLEIIPSRKGILSLIDFLSKVRNRAVKSDGNKSINVDHIEKS